VEQHSARNGIPRYDKHALGNLPHAHLDMLPLKPNKGGSTVMKIQAYRL